MGKLTKQFAQAGKVTYISIRPKRKEAPVSMEEVEITVAKGLAGDHNSKKGSKRQVTLIQAEHIAAVASFMGAASIDPGVLRRNIVVEGINLLSLKGKQFEMGDAILEYTGKCQPCSRMEENLGTGGYNAMRGHGGITCKVISDGFVSIGSEIKVIK